MHNENRNPLLNLLNNSISARSAPQIFSLRDEYTSRFSSFLIIALSNFSAYSRTVLWVDRSGL